MQMMMQLMMMMIVRMSKQISQNLSVVKFPVCVLFRGDLTVEVVHKDL
jgi:hypothetical protein